MNKLPWNLRRILRSLPKYERNITMFEQTLTARTILICGGDEKVVYFYKNGSMNGSF